MTANIIIKDLEIQFITKKVNNFNTMISYFKVVDQKADKKLKPVLKLSETLIKPIWKSGAIYNDVIDDCWMLKSKYSHIEKTIMEKNQKFKVDLVLVSFSDPDTKDVIKGYYARLNNMKSVVVEEKSEGESD